MADRAFDPADPEIVPLLRSMELDRDLLIEVVRAADRERTFVTSNDIRGFDLIIVNAKAARGLRDIFCDKRWIKDETDNQPGIVNPYLGLRVIPCNFDENAGNPLKDPTNRSPKGEASRSKTRCNATGWLPGLPDIPAQEGEKYLTWILGIFSKENEPLKAEISLPVRFTGSYYMRFSSRIPLLTGSEDYPEPAARPVPDRQGPTEDVDISIRRK